MRLNSKEKSVLKYQKNIDDSSVVYLIICIYTVTATIISMLLYLKYREYLTACYDSNKKQIDEIGSDLGLYVVLGTVWSLIKIMLIAYIITLW